jgi:hypothetical protein
MGNGDFWGHELGFRGGFALLCALLTGAGLIAVVRHVRATASRWREADHARLVYVAFWAGCAAATLAVFVFSTAPVNQLTFRYIVPAWFSLAALLPLTAAARRWARPAITAGVCAIAAASTIAVARGDASTNPGWPDHALAEELERRLEPLDVTKGYAGYWDAAPITWATHTRLKVYPVWQCQPPEPALCRFYFHNISSWYEPEEGARTFLIVDPEQPFVTGPDPAFGEPIRTFTVGRLTVHVYDDDIAAHVRGR